MSELEKIQFEIEEDLRKLGLADAKPLDASPLDESPSDESHAEAFADATLPEIIIPADITPTECSASESFYREIIRQSPPLRTGGAKPYSWRKRFIAICLICTLGTGTLGFGIGAAGKVIDFLWFGGINKVLSGDTPTDSSAYMIESASYLFTGDENGEGTLSDMVELVEPSAVKVMSTFPPAETENLNPFYQQQTEQASVSSASGIIFSEDEKYVYVATNYHVVGGADSVSISISGGESIPASPVGSEAAADLAVISVDKRDLRSAGITSIVIANFGDSDLMEVGDTVVAIGNALGEGNIATRGIISAKEKVINIENRELTVLQTDAAINFGNSGGMLLNTRGEVIGINSARLFGTSVEGMGYSISSNIAKPILEELMNISSRPSLGIYGNTITAEAAESAGIPPMGVLVASTIPGSGAERAGIIPDDIITGFNNEPVLTMEVLVEAIRECGIGDTVELKVYREGNLLTLNVILGETVANRF